MTTYQIKYQLKATGNKEISKLETSRNKDLNVCKKEYIDDATARTTLGIMEMVCAHIHIYENNSETPTKLETIVDRR